MKIRPCGGSAGSTKGWRQKQSSWFFKRFQKWSKHPTIFFHLVRKNYLRYEKSVIQQNNLARRPQIAFNSVINFSEIKTSRPWSVFCAATMDCLTVSTKYAVNVLKVKGSAVKFKSWQESLLFLKEGEVEWIKKLFKWQCFHIRT